MDYVISFIIGSIGFALLWDNWKIAIGVGLVFLAYTFFINALP